jgi:hypothetical protein
MNFFDILLGLALIVLSVLGMRVRYLQYLEARKGSSQVSNLHISGGVRVESVTSPGNVSVVSDSRGVSFRVDKGGVVKGTCNGKPFHFVGQCDDDEFRVIEEG